MILEEIKRRSRSWYRAFLCRKGCGLTENGNNPKTTLIPLNPGWRPGLPAPLGKTRWFTWNSSQHESGEVVVCFPRDTVSRNRMKLMVSLLISWHWVEPEEKWLSRARQTEQNKNKQNIVRLYQNSNLENKHLKKKIAHIYGSRETYKPHTGTNKTPS